MVRELPKQESAEENKAGRAYAQCFDKRHCIATEAPGRDEKEGKLSLLRSPAPPAAADGTELQQEVRKACLYVFCLI